MKNKIIGVTWAIFWLLPVASFTMRNQHPEGKLLMIFFILANVPVIRMLYSFLSDTNNHDTTLDKFIRTPLKIYGLLLTIVCSFLTCKGILLLIKTSDPNRIVMLHLMSSFGIMIGIILFKMAQIGKEKPRISNQVRFVVRVNFVLGAIVFTAGGGFFIEQLKQLHAPGMAASLIAYGVCLAGAIFVMRGATALSLAQHRVHVFWPSFTLLTSITLPILYGFMWHSCFLEKKLTGEAAQIIFIGGGFVGLWVSTTTGILTIALFRGQYFESLATESVVKFAGVKADNNPNKISQIYTSSMAIRSLSLSFVLIFTSYYMSKYTIYKKSYAIMAQKQIKTQKYYTFTEKLSQQSGSDFQETYSKTKDFSDTELLKKIYKQTKYQGAALAFFYQMAYNARVKGINKSLFYDIEASMLTSLCTQALSRDEARRIAVFENLQYFLKFNDVYRTFLYSSKDPNPKVAQLITNALKKHEKNMGLFQQSIREDFNQRMKNK